MRNLTEKTETFTCKAWTKSFPIVSFNIGVKP